ncbi:hypothetical protein GQ457_18G009110 [Hibiscus cannabinus]
MKSVLPSCISNTQAAFVQGRAITDNILVAHELVHTLHTSVSRSSQGAIFKLDMEKAFYRVEWPFLKAVMLRLGFAQSWVELIMRCVSSVSSRIRVRGTLSEAFLLHNVASAEATRSRLSLSFYTEELSTAAPPRLPSEVSDPGIYLGVPLLIGKNKYAAFGRYRDKMDTRVSKWSNLLLSFSGREVLIKSIAQAMPQYIMSCYLLPCSLVEEMSRSICRFWWSRKGSARGWPFVAWADLCMPKAAGGMGFKDLHLFNIALLGSADNEEIPLRCREFMVPGQPLWDHTKLSTRLSLADVESIVEVPISSDWVDRLIWGDHDSASILFAQTTRPPPSLQHLSLRRPTSPFPWGPAFGMQGFLMVPAHFVDLDLRTPSMPFATVQIRHWLFDKLVLPIPFTRWTRPRLRPGLALQRLLSLRDRWPCSSPSFGASGDINGDGAFLPTTCHGAIGVLARDSSGAVHGGFARPIPVISPASAVEAFALFAGLEFAIANGWASTLIESDAAVLVNKIHRPTPDLSLLGDLLAPSRHLIAASCGRLRVGFAPRPANSAAHTLASWACQHNDVISFTFVCLELISRIVLDNLSSSF